MCFSPPLSHYMVHCHLAIYTCESHPYIWYDARIRAADPDLLYLDLKCCVSFVAEV